MVSKYKAVKFYVSCEVRSRRWKNGILAVKWEIPINHSHDSEWSEAEYIAHSPVVFSHLIHIRKVISETKLVSCPLCYFSRMSLRTCNIVTDTMGLSSISRFHYDKLLFAYFLCCLLYLHIYYVTMFTMCKLPWRLEVQSVFCLHPPTMFHCHVHHRKLLSIIVC